MNTYIFTINNIWTENVSKSMPDYVTQISFDISVENGSAKSKLSNIMVNLPIDINKKDYKSFDKITHTDTVDFIKKTMSADILDNIYKTLDAIESDSVKTKKVKTPKEILFSKNGK